MGRGGKRALSVFGPRVASLPRTAGGLLGLELVSRQQKLIPLGKMAALEVGLHSSL